MLLFLSLLLPCASAAAVYINTVSCASYFQTFNSSGVWTDVLTPQHNLVETGQPVYCLQPAMTNPNSSIYDTVEPELYYDSTTIKGLQAIMENGYPNDLGGFTADQARYATANAIRFYMAERGCEGSLSWMNLSLYSQFFRGKSGYTDLYDWCMYLVDCARTQTMMKHGVFLTLESSSPTESGGYYIFTANVSLTNCDGGYTYDESQLPNDAVISGYTGRDDDQLTIKIPSSYNVDSFTLSCTGYDSHNSTSLVVYNPLSPAEQRTLGYVSGSSTACASDSINLYLPSGTPYAGTLELKKVDADTGEPLAGAELTLYDLDLMYYCDGTTDENGIFSISDLPYGIWFYQETKAPYGYALESGFNQIGFSNENPVMTIEIENTAYTGSIQITKTDAETGAALENAGYRLYNSEGAKIAQAYTDSNGRLSFSGLKYGDYSYAEFSAPEGYELDSSSYSFTVNSSSTIFHSRQNTPTPEEIREGSIEVNKISTDGSALCGAAFLLEASSDGGNTWTAVDKELSTDANGKLCFTGLTADGSVQYRLTETRSPEGHELMLGPLELGTLPAEVSDPDAVDAYTLYVTVTDCPVFRLPATGGGSFYYIPLAMSLMAITILFYKKEKKQ